MSCKPLYRHILFQFAALLLLLLLQAGLVVSATNAERYLSEEKFLSYEPKTTVTDDAAIDLDVRDLIAELAKGNRQGALQIYTQGSYSKSYAVLNLSADNALPVNVAKGTELLGQTSSGKQVLGETLKDAQQGDTTISFRYHASTVQAQWTNCHVGGNPNPNLEGCLAPTGSIEIDDLGSFSYTYNPKEGNKNARTLQTLSTKAQEKMFGCDDGCPYPTYLRLYQYYAIADYGNRWITSAFNKTKCHFAKGETDFSEYLGADKDEGANEAIIKGAVVLNLWMYINREMEHAEATCLTDDTCEGADCSNEGRLHAWDKAVAFYTGSEPKTTGYGGYLLYSLAQKFCRNFGTCLTTTKEAGMAHVNSQIFRNFRQGQQDLVMSNCGAVAASVKRITELMTVPLIQGVLRYAYHQDNPPVHNLNAAKTEAEGATYAAALIPLVHTCNQKDAETLYNNMRVGNGGTADFQVVKSLLEKNYECLGVTCSDVGGLLDVVQQGAYMPGAEPCGNYAQETTSSNSETSTSNTSKEGTDGPNVGLAVGISLFFVFLLVIVAALASRKGSSHQEEDYAAPVAVPEMT